MKNTWPFIVIAISIILMAISFFMSQKTKEDDKITIIKLRDSIRMMHKIDSIKYSHHE